MKITPAAIKSIKTEATEITKQIEGLETKASDGITSHDDFVKELAKVHERSAALTASVAALTAKK